MAANWQDTIQEAAQKTAQAINDATEMEVTTNFKDQKAGLDAAPILKLYTKMQLDGDSQTDVPVEVTPAGATVNSQFYDIHLANVESSREYRASMMKALLEAVQSAMH